jgi:isopenicillin N synthase-like dioxygenase
MAATPDGNNPSDKSPIPIIDLTPFTSPSTLSKRSAVAANLADACRRVGFVYIVNHGLDPELLKCAFAWSKKLYALSHDEKMQAPHPDGYAVHRGYSYPGLEKVSNAMAKGEGDEEVVGGLREVVDCKESYEIGSEDNLDQPNVWLPEPILPGYREFMNNFYWQLYDVSKIILKALALGIGLDEDHLLKFHSGLNNQLRLLHYPPVKAGEVESGRVARMPAHSDWSSMTMLFQDDCGGLEVEDPNVPGKFVEAKPVEGAIVMNIGDLMQHWSNGIIPFPTNLFSRSIRGVL